ncbi:MAG: hypothetical protein BGO68_00815 [Candidatus Amoebophilus sp. 36-38]|nr:MAG: hypothetical protein BGO68_00815 [Candidatus Amoebophilus sp. 36-38]
MAISSKIKRLLLAGSGGFCQNPECNTSLFLLSKNEKVDEIEELAHIVGKNTKSPRGKNNLSLRKRNEYGNIIVLCPNCHTKIDKSPELFTVDLLKEWKNKHEEKIKARFHIPEFKTRLELKQEIEPLLLENKLIFNQYGPQSLTAIENPQCEEASARWREKSFEKIIPNNRKIYELLQRNIKLLNDNEKTVLIQFKMHTEDFEHNTLAKNKNPTVSLFPEKIIEILN